MINHILYQRNKYNHSLSISRLVFKNRTLMSLILFVVNTVSGGVNGFNVYLFYTSMISFNILATLDVLFSIKEMISFNRKIKLK
ncbi:hypothetical protein HERIO_2562 [Hepatospora eriocheir]|uniref:Uncharacterized protein n=1 Tax=Hepatospora eriocheir TaxID=1081669 RepID=A0A1X0Q6G2_9MICR|nr:hypothetical protein HERIO_2562 [Hepatospora eriocheir]